MSIEDASTAIVTTGMRERLDRSRRSGSVRSPRRGAWQPPEGVTPDDARRVIAAAACERDRLLMRTLWATGGRVSEVTALRPCDVERDSLVLVNLKNPHQPTKRVYLAAADHDLPGELLVWARERELRDDAPLFFSRKRGPDGAYRSLSRVQVWQLVKDAAARAGVRVLALRASRAGRKGDPAPLHPHIFRHARVRQIVRTTRSLPLAQRQAGWSRLQMAYLTVGDIEARDMMASVRE